MFSHLWTFLCILTHWMYLEHPRKTTKIIYKKRISYVLKYRWTNRANLATHMGKSALLYTCTYGCYLPAVLMYSEFQILGETWLPMSDTLINKWTTKSYNRNFKPKLENWVSFQSIWHLLMGLFVCILFVW